MAISHFGEWRVDYKPADPRQSMPLNSSRLLYLDCLLLRGDRYPSSRLLGMAGGRPLADFGIQTSNPHVCHLLPGAR